MLRCSKIATVITDTLEFVLFKCTLMFETAKTNIKSETETEN